jgi:hypothetical protein
MTGRSKQKIRSNIKRVLIEIQKAAQEAEEGSSPFDAVGSTDAKFISAEGAYRHMADDINWDDVAGVITTVNERTWRDEEYARALTAMITCASKIATMA